MRIIGNDHTTGTTQYENTNIYYFLNLQVQNLYLQHEASIFAYLHGK